MQSPRRLKLLAVVLLMASGLMGGVAFWHYSAQLNEEERRLVGLWTHADGRAYSQNFRSDRRFHLNVIASLGLDMRWRLNDGLLLIYRINSGSNGMIPLPDSVFKIANLIPGANGFVCPQTTEISRLCVRWNGEDNIFLSNHQVEIGGCGAGLGEFTMRRVTEK
ncbi:hypothetical protein [Planctomicrobium piriforme]|uniref:Uncharacterized protein n=1 Tax=Planctomicrobium piriforme TaxID=1576369 RepID=A0A1I3KBI9_9PLAN|nr:hypothetical protein [Planctomicrobium piriforme]SFI69881.1 hypothetical protein SAMN05421753_111178 [Planctomicrobium piriforme]